MKRLERPSDCEHHRDGRCADPWAKCGRCCWDCELVADCQDACEEAAASSWRELRAGDKGVTRAGSATKFLRLFVQVIP